MSLQNLPITEPARRWAYPPPKSTPNPAPDSGTEFLDFIGPVDGLHVLVIGPDILEIICGLTARGAKAVTTMRDHLVRTDPADLAIAPHVTCLEIADLAIWHALRAIRPLNSLYLGFGAECAAKLVPQTRKRLVAHGFGVSHTRHLGRMHALVADMPLFGALKSA